MSDITAAVGVAQLRKLDKIFERKRELAKYWDEKLRAIEFIVPPHVSENVKHIYQSYVGLLDKRINRNKQIETLCWKRVFKHKSGRMPRISNPCIIQIKNALIRWKYLNNK